MMLRRWSVVLALAGAAAPASALATIPPPVLAPEPPFLKRVTKRSIVLRRGAQTPSLGRLSAGSYQALVVATDRAGNRSVPRLIAFAVRR